MLYVVSTELAQKHCHHCRECGIEGVRFIQLDANTDKHAAGEYAAIRFVIVSTVWLDKK